MESSRFFTIFFWLAYAGSSIAQDVSIQPVLLDVGNQNDLRPDSPMRQAAFRSSRSVHPPLTQWFDASSRNGTGFYLFYNQVEVRQLPAAFVVQKIKRTITSVTPAGVTETKTAYLIEALKLDNGYLKKPDQHFGSFEIRNEDRRIIRKECEVGVISEIADTKMDATKWQWQEGLLYQKLHDYADDPTEAPTVKFVCSRKWDFEFVLTCTGGFSLSVPDLGYSTVVSVPQPLVSDNDSDRTQTAPPQLQAGTGLPDSVEVGVSTLSDAVRVFGKPKTVHPQKNQKRNVEFHNGLIAHIDANDTVMTIMNAPGCIVQAELDGEKVKVGDAKNAILQKLGQPLRRVGADQVFTYRGLTIWFDGESASKIVVSKPLESK